MKIKMDFVAIFASLINLIWLAVVILIGYWIYRSASGVGILKSINGINRIFLSSLVIWVLALFVLPMAFDMPGSEKMLYPKVIVGLYLFYPVVVLLGYFLSKQIQSISLSLLPVIYMVFSVVVLLIVSRF